MSQYIVLVPLPPEAPVPSESLQATPVDTDSYKIIASPFVAYDIHKGDIVRTTPGPHGPVYEGLVRAGGHGTARVLFAEQADFMARARALMALKVLGLTAEDPKGRYYTLDVPTGVSIDAVAEALDDLQERGVLEFELLPAQSDP